MQKLLMIILALVCVPSALAVDFQFVLNDDSPATDTQLALQLINTLGQEGYQPEVGAISLFSTVDEEGLSADITFAISDGTIGVFSSHSQTDEIVAIIEQDYDISFIEEDYMPPMAVYFGLDVPQELPGEDEEDFVDEQVVEEDLVAEELPVDEVIEVEVEDEPENTIDPADLNDAEPVEDGTVGIEFETEIIPREEWDARQEEKEENILEKIWSFLFGWLS